METNSGPAILENFTMRVTVVAEAEAIAAAEATLEIEDITDIQEIAIIPNKHKGKCQLPGINAMFVENTGIGLQNARKGYN